MDPTRSIAIAERECSLCRQDTESGKHFGKNNEISLPCGHLFHNSCFNEARRSSPLTSKNMEQISLSSDKCSVCGKGFTMKVGTIRKVIQKLFPKPKVHRPPTPDEEAAIFRNSSTMRGSSNESRKESNEEKKLSFFEFIKETSPSIQKISGIEEADTIPPRTESFEATGKPELLSLPPSSFWFV